MELQELLNMIFISEKNYFEAAQSIQIVKFSRFLNHQSSKRNSLSNKLIEAFHDNNITPNITYIEKNTVNLSGLQIKRKLENRKYIPIFKKCMEYDNLIIEKCKNLVLDPNISIDILEVISQGMGQLILSNLKGRKIIAKFIKDKKQTNPKVKVIQLGLVGW